MTDTPSDPVSEADASRVVEVLPRYLAGCGTYDLATLWPFPVDQGWSVHAPPLGQRIATSPCQRVRCGNNERRRTVVEVREDPFAALTWGATFDWDTPAELLADFHGQLLRSYGHADRSLDSFLVDHARPVEVYLPLLAAGWHHEVSTDGWQKFTSPDGFAVLRHHYTLPAQEGADGWRMTVGRYKTPLWEAAFTAAAPIHLVTAFTASVVAKAPLIRTVGLVPPDARLHLGLPLRVASPSPAGPAVRPALGLPTAPGRSSTPGPRR